MDSPLLADLIKLFLLTMNVVLHVYLWRKMVSAPRFKGALRVALGAVIVAFAVVVPLKFLFTRPFAGDNYFPLQPVVWSWLGFAFYTLLIFVPSDLMALFSRRTSTSEVELEEQAPSISGEKARVGESEHDGANDALDRRRFVARAVAGTASMAAAAVTTYGVVRANSDFELPEIAVSLPRLPKQLEGFKIVHLSDIHIGPVLDGRFVDHLVMVANSLKPDLVCITGDVVDGSVRDIGAQVARLSRLEAKYGVALTTGNHEYYSGAGPWLSFFEQLGFHVLKNQRVAVGDRGAGGASFDLAGIHDRQGADFHPQFRPDLSRALVGRDPERELILMAHQLAQVAMAEGRGVGLQLSGHTHGGQVWPFGAVTRLIQPYLQGHAMHQDGTQIYVSCGAGYWGPPLRVGAPPEVASLILTG